MRLIARNFLLLQISKRLFSQGKLSIHAPGTWKPCLGIRIAQPVFDKKFFTFPIHYPLVGLVELNEHFVLDFFASATSIFHENGETSHISLKNGMLKILWNVVVEALTIIRMSLGELVRVR